MLVELHLLQNFAPANLNRDDTGAPKDCEFGGYRRARISSQCLKRAMRTAFREERLLPADRLAARTKGLRGQLADRLAEQGRPPTDALAVATTLLDALGLHVDDEGKTQYLVFLGHDELAALAALALDRWDDLIAAAPPAPEPDAEPVARGRGGARAAKQRGRAAVPPDLATALRRALDGGRAADLALFGRMLADLLDRNVDAASQVAHALSTHAVSMEFDFYTAVDDLNTREETGAGMLGTVEFNSACFYRYANVDLAQLTDNLGGDAELAHRTLDAFLRAAVAAIPTGKQNSMAAHNPPSFLLAVVRDRGPWNLANAFVRPVRPTADGDLVRNSVGALDTYWGQLARMYGTGGITATAAVSLDGDGLDVLAPALVSSVADLVARVLGAVADATPGAPA